MTETKALYDESVSILNKLQQAMRIEHNIVEKIAVSVNNLKANPTDIRERRELVNLLDKKRRIIDIARKGARQAIFILKKVKTLAYSVQASDDIRADLITLVNLLLSAMKFANKDIKYLEKVVAYGEALEDNNYSANQLEKFIEALAEEKKEEQKMINGLQGEFGNFSSAWDKLASRLRLPRLAAGAIAGGLGAAAGGTLAVFGATLAQGLSQDAPMFSSGVQTNNNTVQLAMIMGIMATSLGLVLGSVIGAVEPERVFGMFRNKQS